MTLYRSFKNYKMYKIFGHLLIIKENIDCVKVRSANIIKCRVIVAKYVAVS